MRFGPAGMPFSVAAIAMLAAPIARAQVPAFSGAEGFGGTFTGSAPAGGWFSNATVYHVTTNQDVVDGSGKPLPGTLRYAFYTPTSGGLKQNASNVIVVFDVGGTFQLTNGSLDIKTVNNIYIAGQTAPSPVVLYGDTSQITHSSNTVNSNVILRYMTFRKGTGNGSDSVTFAGGSGPGDSVATNLIFDHVRGDTWLTCPWLSSKRAGYLPPNSRTCLQTNRPFSRIFSSMSSEVGFSLSTTTKSHRPS